MTGGAEKRPSDEGVFADTKKKKKISRGKCEVDPLTEKTSNGHLLQKKAFFAYFGKSFVENKKANANHSDAGKANKVETVKSKPKRNLSPDDSNNCSDEKALKTAIYNKQNISHSKPINAHLIEKNFNLSYVSSFIEDVSCFPKITHVNRLTPLCSSDLMIQLNEETFHSNDVKTSTLLLQFFNSEPKKLILEPYLMKLDVPFRISSLKKSVPNFPVLEFHKHIKKKYLAANKSMTDIEFMWIDKYKPTCKQEVLGNSEVMKGLKKWLQPDKINSKKAKKNRRYDDDDDDFIFNNDSDSSGKAQRNLAILLGPSGCGKTSAVYAVANELNANVIEVNASCNRNGKRIISDLMEATQSHAVEKNCLMNMMKGKKKNAKNLKKKKSEVEKMTIILIEDADILFDNYDDGFLSAISTLASDSKRPLVLTANDPFSIHLLKFVLPNEIIFNFVHPLKEDLNCFLQLMALNEGVIMSENDINAFIHPFKSDIRQSILQLQYVLSTGEIDIRTQKCIHKNNINSIWWNWPFVIGCNLASIENENQVKCNFDMASISLNLDIMSKLNLMYSKTQGYDFLDAQPFWNHLIARDSASLVETHDWSDYSVQLSTDITHWIYNHISTKDYVTEKLYPSSEDLSRRQKIWHTSKDVLEQIGLDYCNRKNETSLDYLATIRSFNKNQQVNQPFGNLRHSKTFSYLKRINIDVDCKDLKFFCESFNSESNCDQEVEISDQF